MNTINGKDERQEQKSIGCIYEEKEEKKKKKDKEKKKWANMKENRWPRSRKIQAWSDRLELIETEREQAEIRNWD